MITYLLECGHFGQRRTLAEVDSIMPCVGTTHSGLPASPVIRVVAVECREWRVVCQSCTYRRWTGQDVSQGHILAGKHTDRTGHNRVTIEFMTVPSLKEAVRAAFGIRVKTHFEEKPSVDASRLSNSLNVAVAKREELAGQKPLF